MNHTSAPCRKPRDSTQPDNALGGRTTSLMSDLYCGLRRWPSWVFACVSGAYLARVLKAHNLYRLCLNCSLPTTLSAGTAEPEPGVFHSSGWPHAAAQATVVTFRTVDLFARHHRPRDARHLVRKSNSYQARRASLQDLPEPGTHRIVPACGPVNMEVAPNTNNVRISRLPVLVIRRELAELFNPLRSRETKFCR